MYTDVYVSHPPEEIIVMYVSQLKKVFSNMVQCSYNTCSRANLHLHVNLKQAGLERLKFASAYTVIQTPLGHTKIVQISEVFKIKCIVIECGVLAI